MQAVAVPARIDVDNAMQVLAALRDAARGSAPVALDLSPLREFDSSALSLLLQLARDRNGAGADNSRRGDASAQECPGVADVGWGAARGGRRPGGGPGRARAREAARRGAEARSRRGNSRRGDASAQAQDVASGGTGAAPAPSAHWPLFLLNPPDKLRELAELYGVAQMLFGTPGAAGRQASQA